jgi:hypothetical protein
LTEIWPIYMLVPAPAHCVLDLSKTHPESEFD